ncbi:GTP 3',8-cyclase MoaA [Dokdonella sp.]|uniref:GTP 3',8-cyclase MoaA n=1 Tax=Dokdonella sp. TaxID=2291710 RepID=UPI001B042E5F|nr:GTP 3',8-cyclase MoaA [Dokdonella sp.]MBO9664154.1 GTP 3',8-cyclase MoaA [Dokdonella sp.]
MDAPAIPLGFGPAAQRDLRGRVLRDLRISVVDRCNFRCPYCMPEDQYPRDHEFLSKAERLRFEEIERLTRIFATLGVHKLRLTGGEPLLRRDLPELVRKLAAVPGIDDVALTTNGSLLAPQAQALREAGLQRITLSLDTIVPETFRRMSGGRGEVGVVLEAIAAAERAGFAPLKLNVVVMRGTNDDEVLGLLERFRGSGHIVRFIEYMDVGTCNDWRRDLVVPSAELRARIAARWPLRELEPNYGGEVARRYAFADGGGEIGFISSVTEPFCGDCSRARLSADGRLYTCLFAGSGHDLRGPLRAGIGDAELAGLIRAVWSAREDRYSELRSEATSASREHVEMYAIGG